MASFQVSFQLEAESLADAEAAVAQWTVTPGTTLTMIFGSVQSEGTPHELPEGGTVGTLSAE